MPNHFPYRLAVVLFVASVIGVPRALPAQVVRGRVVDSTTQMPVGRGFVVLLDQSGNEVARSLSSDDGRFTLVAPTGGIYQLRSERIGFGASLSEPLQLDTDQAVEVRLSVAALPVRLATLVVPGRNRCSTNPEQGENTVLIWEEVRKALAAAVWADEQELFHYRMYSYRRELDARRSRTLTETGSTRSAVTDPPYRSVPAEQLAQEGYVVERADGVWYYVPDAYVLLDQRFLGTHCFHVVRDDGEHPEQVGLAFEPMSDRRLPDVEGTLWLDETSSELRELEVQHTRVQYNVKDSRIGGTVRFLMLPTGAWIVHEWQVRTPRITVTEDPRQPQGYTSRVNGFADTGGEIYQVSSRDGTTIFEAPLATVSGFVFDSTSGTGLQGALITVAGTNFRAFTDTGGRFALGVPLEGEYSLSLSHPHLDSVAASNPLEHVDLVRDSDTEVTFAVPHVRSTLSRICGRTVESRDDRVIFGVVRESGTGVPISRASVSASWQDIDLSNQGVTVGSTNETVKSDTSGFFAICNAPAGRSVRLSAAKDGRTSREADLLFPHQVGGLLLLSWDKPPGQPYDHEYAAPQPAWKIDLTLGAQRER